MARAPDLFDRLAGVDLIVLDDGPALRRFALEVTDVRTRLPEPDLLRYAASAFRHLADVRTEALASSCRERRIPLLKLPAVNFDAGVTVMYGHRRIWVREYSAAADSTGPLAVEIDGTIVGLIEFGRSSRLEAAPVIRRLRELTGAAIALVSSRPGADVSAWASASASTVTCPVSPPTLRGSSGSAGIAG